MLFPRLLDENGIILYDIRRANANVVLENGLCGFKKSLDAVRTKLKADIHRVELGLADFRTEVVGLLGQLGSRLTAVETTSQHTQAAMYELRQDVQTLLPGASQ